MKKVLMADDDEDDCLLARLALEESGATAAFCCTEDGFKLMDFLSEHSRADTKRLPDLLLLDLNMPRKDGRQVLMEIKAEPAFRHIPVVILSTSKEQKDIDFSMTNGAALFMTKPADFDGWIEMMKSLANRWLNPSTDSSRIDLNP